MVAMCCVVWGCRLLLGRCPVGGRHLALGGVLALGLGGLSPALWAGEVRVYAAASLTDALGELAQRYQQRQPGVVIKTSFAGSSTLARQIEKGAPADLFISADLDWADYLDKRGLLDSASRRELLRNRLVVIAPQGRGFGLQLDAAKPLADQFAGRLCTGDPAFVPVGKYARQALAHYRWWDSIQPRLVGTEDVRTALAFVERGECALGIVYQTDARLSRKVIQLAVFPPDSHPPILYPGALLRGASGESAAFWQFLQSPEAAAVFQGYGFGVGLDSSSGQPAAAK